MNRNFMSQCFCFAFTFLLSCVGFAFSSSELEKKFLEKLHRSQNSSELRKLREEYEQLGLSATACRLQIEKAKFPLDCFVALDLSKKWQLQMSFNMNRFEIEKFCANASSGEAMQNTQKKILLLRGVIGESCFQRWKEAVADNEYAGRSQFK